MQQPLSKEMAELREWIVEHGVAVRELRTSAETQGVRDTGDYLHWLEKEVLELRAEAKGLFI